MPPLPPPIPSTALPPPRATNTPAVTGFILGLIGCVPFLTGALAIPFSIAGLRRSRVPGVGGRGLAIAGLILVSLSVLGWAVFGGSAYAFFVGTTELRNTAKDFVRDIGQHRTDEAVALFATPVTPDKLDPLFDLVAPLGPFTDSTVTSVSVNYENGTKTAQVAGSALFVNGGVAFQLSMIKIGNNWKVVNAHLDAPTKNE